MEEVETSLETAQPTKKAKGLFPRNAFWWALGIFLVVMCFMAARDIKRSVADQEAKPVSQASSAPVGPAPNPEDLKRIAAAQVQRGDRAASEAEAAKGGQQGAGEGRRPVVPNVPVPREPSPTQADARAPTPGGRFGNAAVGAQVEEQSTAEAEAVAGRRTSQIVALEGEGSGGQDSLAQKVAQAVGASPLVTGADREEKPDDVYKQAESLIKLANQQSPAGVLGAAAAAAHPTSRDVSWLKDFSTEGSGKVSDVTRATQLPTKNIVLQGTRVPVVSLEAVNSDMPGDISARCTSDVYDSLDQRRVLIPRGTRFVGKYSSEIRPGQTRVLHAFSRMVLPDGRSVDLMGARGVDNLGRAGIEGNVDNHFLKMFGHSLAIAWIGTKLSNQGLTSSTSADGQTTTSSVAGQVLGDVTRQMLARNASIPPTITREAGTPFFIIITKDIALEPWTTK